MESERSIKLGIESLVTTYSLWAIGSTDDPDRRVLETGKPVGWRLFDAPTEEVATNVEAHFVRKGMEDDTGALVSAGKYVYIFMGLRQRLESVRSLNQAWTFDGISAPKTMAQNQRYLADFEILYGKRPDFHFLQGIYAQVIAERDPDTASVAELLATLYRRLESQGFDVAELA